VVICDIEGQILDLNLAAVTLFGSSEAALRSQHFTLTVTDLAEESRRSAIEAECGRLLATGVDFHSEFTSHDGRLIELSASGVRGGDGETSGFYAVLRDCTEHRRHEEFIRQGDRMEIVASLTSGIAHEVNNPLAFVRANLNYIQRIGTTLSEEALRDGAQKREEFDELKQVAEESLDGIERIGAIVERMRRFSVVQQGEVASVDLNVVVDDAIRMSKLWSGDALPIRTDLAVFLPPIRGSAQHLVQAVLNLLVNARDAVDGQTDRRVRIETRRHMDEVEIRILDNGPGVSIELQQRFQSPDAHAELIAEGEGLGLAIAHGIIRDHGGTLDLEAGLEEGSAFVIRLPAAGTIS
jgi:PAS domain S-box-containing protein